MRLEGKHVELKNVQQAQGSGAPPFCSSPPAYSWKTSIDFPHDFHRGIDHPPPRRQLSVRHLQPADPLDSTSSKIKCCRSSMMPPSCDRAVQWLNHCGGHIISVLSPFGRWNCSNVSWRPPKLEVKGDPDSTLFHRIPPDLNYFPNGYAVNLFRTTHRKRVLPTQDPVSLQRCGSRANSCERPLRSKSHQGRWGGARAQNIHSKNGNKWKPRHEQTPFSMSLPSCSKKQGNPILSHIIIYIYIMFPKKTTKKIIIQ